MASAPADAGLYRRDVDAVRETQARRLDVKRRFREDFSPESAGPQLATQVRST
jgi:hypothetical protein